MSLPPLSPFFSLSLHPSERRTRVVSSAAPNGGKPHLCVHGGKCVETHPHLFLFISVTGVVCISELHSYYIVISLSSHPPSLFPPPLPPSSSLFTVSEFWVSVQQTDAATRCGLQGAYWLHVAGDELVLKDAETRNCLQTWPYRLLRRYGRDKVIGGTVC